MQARGASRFISGWVWVSPAGALSSRLRVILESAMAQTRQKRLKLLTVLAALGLAACGGGGGGSGPPKVQPVVDAQESNILINIRAGYGPASWVLLQYDGQAQLYNVFVNRGQLPVPTSGGK